MALFSGFSKLNREQRIDYIVQNSLLISSDAQRFDDYCAPEENQQRVYSEMIENYIGNFPIPMGVVTNMVINDETFIVPYVMEESSVIAAASKAAKFWAERGGFKATVPGMVKKGQVHFTWNGKPQSIKEFFPLISKKLFEATNTLTEKMRQRGGGITAIQLIDKTEELPDYYQVDVSFETADAMGANFINTCLEKISSEMQDISELNFDECRVEIIMAILSNYTPECLVRCWLECPVEKLEGWNKELSYNTFATKFKQSVDIANLDISRAVTHNKGIFNGIDAVLLATGNDWRATSASAHAYASREGKYRGLTTVRLKDKIFTYELELPLAIGTVGGITGIHPMVKNSLSILKYPDAEKLMMIAASAGLASNFAAIASLITTGIQAGHMKMHLSNILNQLSANPLESEKIRSYFFDKSVSYTAVEEFIGQLRRKNDLNK
ncbi:MAG: hydroxymethylglutaryl-CoA reductase [Mariniphaga sp.]|nr:hydroxymethylglutaryl-CoA reductase [Mariniphaga sp.]